MTSAERPAFPRLTFPQLWVALAILLPVLAALIATMSTVDLAYNVRAGELMLDRGAVLRTDPFAFTTGGGAWLDQQWAAQVLLALGFRAGGWALLSLIRAGLVAVVIGLVFVACRRSGAGLRVAAWLSLAAFILAAAAMGMRPQLFGMVLFAATVAILASRSRLAGRSTWLLWLIPVLVIPWASIHGSFFLAPVAVGVAWLEDLVAGRPGSRRLLAVAIASGLASLLNPFGLGVWTYTIGLSTNPTIRRLITEWQPTTPLSATGILLYGSMLVFAILVVLRYRGTVDGSRGALLRRIGPTLLWLLFLGVVAAAAQRGIAWWALGAPVAVARLLSTDAVGITAPAAADMRPERASVLNGAIVLVLAVVGLLLLPFWRGTSLLTDAPTGITAALATRVSPSDRLWNAQAWGSWFELALPGVPIAVDSRIEVIPTTVWDDHLALSAGAPDWEGILDRWKVTVVVASRQEQAALIPLIQTSSVWIEVYQDVDGVVFTRAR